MSKCVGMLTGDGWTTKIDYMRRVYSIDDVCPTIATVTGGGGMELKILVKQQATGRVYYKPVRGGAASTQRSRPVSRDEDECRKEGRSAQRL